MSGTTASDGSRVASCRTPLQRCVTWRASCSRRLQRQKRKTPLGWLDTGPAFWVIVLPADEQGAILPLAQIEAPALVAGAFSSTRKESHGGAIDVLGGAGSKISRCA